MGIYDREYYRDTTRGSGWLSGAAPACKAIILINVAVFIAPKLFPGFNDWFTASSAEVFGKFQVWRLLTATFIHDPTNPWHIVANMYFFWIVGREMEAFYGSRDFSAFYVTAAIFSTLVWALFDRAKPIESRGDMLGASGAVMATMVLYTMYYPRREILLGFVFPVEMWFLLVLYVGYDLLQLLSHSVGPVAYASHLGGAAFGYLYKTVDLRLSTLEKWAKQQRRPKLRIVTSDPRDASPSPTVVRPTVKPTWNPGGTSTTTARPAPVFVIPEEQIDEKLDEILIKIAREGRASLNEEDNRILDEASRRARNRRSERI